MDYSEFKHVDPSEYPSPNDYKGFDWNDCSKDTQRAACEIWYLIAGEGQNGMSHIWYAAIIHKYFSKQNGKRCTKSITETRIEVTTEIQEDYRKRQYECLFPGSEYPFLCYFLQFRSEDGSWPPVKFYSSSLHGLTPESAQEAIQIQNKVLQEMRDSDLIFSDSNVTAAVLGTPHRRSV